MPVDLEKKKRMEQESASSAAVGYSPIALLAGLGALLLIAGIVGIIIFTGGAGIPALAAMAAVAVPAMGGAATGLMFAGAGVAAGGIILGASVGVPVWRKIKEKALTNDLREKLKERNVSVSGNVAPMQGVEERQAPVFQAAPPPPSDLPPPPPPTDAPPPPQKQDDVVLPPMPKVGEFRGAVDLPPPPKDEGLLKGIQDAKKNLKPVEHKDISPKGVKKEVEKNAKNPPVHG